MPRIVLVCAAVLGLAAAMLLNRVGAQPAAAGADCASRIDSLDDSRAEGEERLAEKYKVIAVCARQYARDATIKRLTDACAKYTGQPVVKQQFMADCQLAAFRYANALRDLKAEYGK